MVSYITALSDCRQRMIIDAQNVRVDRAGGKERPAESTKNDSVISERI